MKLILYISSALLLFSADLFGFCDKYLPAISDSKIQSGEMKEISGIASSRKNPGVYWVHNDSGSDASIYAVDEEGKYISKIFMKEVSVKDVRIFQSVNVRLENIALHNDTGNNNGSSRTKSS